MWGEAAIKQEKSGGGKRRRKKGGREGGRERQEGGKERVRSRLGVGCDQGGRDEITAIKDGDVQR